MSQDNLQQEAIELAEGAKGNIKPERLTSTSSGIIEKMKPATYLYQKPIITYFNQDEQPHYFHFNNNKGVKIGEVKEKNGYLGEYRNSMWVTNLGIHFTVGMSPEDFHQFIPFESINGIKTSSGITKNEFKFDTDQGQVRFPAAAVTDCDDTGKYVRRRIKEISKSSTSSQSPDDRDLSESAYMNNSEDVNGSETGELNVKREPSSADKIDSAANTENDDNSIIEMLSDADEFVNTADDVRSGGNIEEAVNKYNMAIGLYEEALKKTNNKETSDRISTSLEETRKKHEETNQQYESISSLREQLQSAERSYKEAVAAFINGSETVANIRFRQARDQYEGALAQVEDTDSDVFETPINILADIAIEQPQQDLTNYGHISDETLSILKNEGMENIQDIKTNSYGRNSVISSTESSLYLESDNNAEVEAALIACWYGDESIKFNSTDDVSMRQQQAKIGFEIT